MRNIWFLPVALVFLLVTLSGLLLLPRGKRDFISPLIPPKPKPLIAYTYENLRQRQYQASGINWEKILTQNKNFTTWIFSFTSDGKRISGTADLPAGVATGSALSSPTIMMIHGYAEVAEYYPGFGTEKVAGELAKNGFVTLAPDFLGYGSSDKPSGNVFEDRFMTYTTVLNLISTYEENCKLKIANCKFGLWGHSNGGQIALSVLEISGKKIPAVLWNPVSKPFPYSILYYTDEFDDRGKALRKNLAEFENDYDVELYSLPNYLDWIEANILLQQGALDESVPQKWSDELAKNLKDKNKKVTYMVYPGADHNMQPQWQNAVSDAVSFFKAGLE